MFLYLCDCIYIYLYIFTNTCKYVSIRVFISVLSATMMDTLMYVSGLIPPPPHPGAGGRKSALPRQGGALPPLPPGACHQRPKGAGTEHRPPSQTDGGAGSWKLFRVFPVFRVFRVSELALRGVSAAASQHQMAMASAHLEPPGRPQGQLGNSKHSKHPKHSKQHPGAGHPPRCYNSGALSPLAL